MARKEPQIGFDGERRTHKTLAVGAAFLGDIGDAIEHQHGRERQLCIAGSEQLTASTCKKIFVFKARTAFRHRVKVLIDQVKSVRPASAPAKTTASLNIAICGPKAGALHRW